MAIEIKNYVILKKLQSNKNSKVYVIRHKKNPTRYALKIISSSQNSNFSQKLKFLQQINHTNIIQLIDFDIKDEQIFLLMEYAEYGDLTKFKFHFDRMDFKAQMNLFYQIIIGVNHIHVKNLVHRDLKPENILIQKNLVPKIADFETSILKSKIGRTFCGTLQYMAPEIFQREKQSEKVDIWALGILLYELTQDICPFQKPCYDNIENIIKNKQLVFKQNTSSLVVDFIYDTLKINPNERPSCDQLLQHKLFQILDKQFKQNLRNEIDTKASFNSSQTKNQNLKQPQKFLNSSNSYGKDNEGNAPSDKSIKSLFIQKYLDMPKSFERNYNKIKSSQSIKDSKKCKSFNRQIQEAKQFKNKSINEIGQMRKKSQKNF